MSGGNSSSRRQRRRKGFACTRSSSILRRPKAIAHSALAGVWVPTLARSPAPPLYSRRNLFSRISPPRGQGAELPFMGRWQPLRITLDTCKIYGYPVIYAG